MMSIGVINFFDRCNNLFRVNLKRLWNDVIEGKKSKSSSLPLRLS
jgi:hypothetical protein